MNEIEQLAHEVARLRGEIDEINTKLMIIGVILLAFVWWRNTGRPKPPTP